MDAGRPVSPAPGYGAAPAPGWLPYDQARGTMVGGPDAAEAQAAPVTEVFGAAHELVTLVNSRYAAIALETDEEDRAMAILDDVGWQLRLPVFDWTMTRGLVRRGGGDEHPMYQTADAAAALAGIHEMRTEAIYVMRDLRSQLGNTGVVRALRDVLDEFQASTRRSTIILLGSEPGLPAALRERVPTYPLGLPSDEEYRATLGVVAQALTLQRSADVALTPLDHLEVVAALRGLTLAQARQVLQHVATVDRRLDLDDLPRIAALKARALSDGGVLEYFPPSDDTAQLGGFERLRAWLDRARVGFSAEAKAMNLPAPKGILLTGVQGCGKSLAAKVIAREWGMPLVKLDAGRIYDKYVGESEKNLRRALAVAESLSPAVLWIDEIEKALSQGSADSNDGGVSQRILGTLLTWMSERTEGVFLVATANDIFGLPPELLRKGRFDELFFVDLPSPAERDAILRIHLQLRRQDPAALSLRGIVDATNGFSGSELEQVVVGTLLGALQRRVPADTTAYIAEAQATVPLSRSRAEDIARLRQLATGRFVPVSA
ncbi:MAG: AAA family ATPase [Solirubrobacteraceae bacterium]|nr:AAA family ATPase [Solirubrobacteraceae bacterium]